MKRASVTDAWKTKDERTYSAKKKKSPKQKTNQNPNTP